MSLRINSPAPNFTAETTHGRIDFHEWIGDAWAVLFSHPKDFTPVCTTELGYMAGIEDEFARRNCKIIGLSVDPVENHERWSKDIEETQGHKVGYPMIGDTDLAVAKLSPISSEMARLLDDTTEIDRILARGAEQAREITVPILKKTYEIVGLVGA